MPKPRWRITEMQAVVLECAYATTKFPSRAACDELASQLGVNARQVRVWFQNKRQRRERPSEAHVATSAPPPASEAPPVHRPSIHVTDDAEALFLLDACVQTNRVITTEDVSSIASILNIPLDKMLRTCLLRNVSMVL